uniref:Transposase n=1 Tax=Candidatus Kentrum sp. SD TaxID=2126332 RepID=A0A450YTT7_9GAMM|nr:MAG: Transposase [Candidatus Kentron sp. SD]VFK44967.1 MAG: Transposase [Candidatus Kentron sp. SD]
MWTVCGFRLANAWKLCGKTYGFPTGYWTELFLDDWCTKTMGSKIEPMKKVARMLRNHRRLLLNWFWAERRFSSGVVEGFNNKVKLTATRKAYGFRIYRAIEIALYHALVNLTVPKITHRFF